MKWLLIGSALVVLALCASLFASVADDLRRAGDEG